MQVHCQCFPSSAEPYPTFLGLDLPHSYSASIKNSFNSSKTSRLTVKPSFLKSSTILCLYAKKSLPSANKESCNPTPTVGSNLNSPGCATKTDEIVCSSVWPTTNPDRILPSASRIGLIFKSHISSSL